MSTAGLPPLTITDVKAICTAPHGSRLVVVKVLTSEPGLYGLGCATFTQRALAVVTAVEEYLRPFLVGKDPDQIEDLYQTAYYSSYWRNGPVLNNALSGVDMALWDIKGKRANMPVYQLLGGKCRKAATLYIASGGRDLQEMEERIRAFQEQGFRTFRADVPIPRAPGDPWDADHYCRTALKTLEHLRSRLGDEIGLILDTHERVPPIRVVGLAKEVERYHLFFLEDPLAPEDSGYLRMLRAQTSTPIAMTELFVNPNEYVPMVRDQLIDYVRAHLSEIGGLSMGRKLAAFCELLGVRTAWHAPGDQSPLGHAADLALDLACHNFGIQECYPFPEAVREVFPGCPEIRDGFLWPNDRPGLGVDLDEKLAARYPYPADPLNGGWPPDRRPDGAVVKP
jgi:mannonate dehydratase